MWSTFTVRAELRDSAMSAVAGVNRQNALVPEGRLWVRNGKARTE